ncbi:hypothetical protein [Desulfoluna sp.]|uniref:hypothetical protein n=1 Tax=Desulfoluna sp. TaxID=2045199 RepID=UPI00260E7B58|nr:hypothetical protein [Desulfoluna sp.]
MIPSLDCYDAALRHRAAPRVTHGPAYLSKIGIVSLAQKSGRPIQAGMWSCDRYWTLKSWDRTRLPKPFSRIVLMYADPIPVAADASRDQCEAIRQRLDERLNTMMSQADRYFESGLSDPREISVPTADLPLRPEEEVTGNLL